MQCPHCRKENHPHTAERIFESIEQKYTSYPKPGWAVVQKLCAGCDKETVEIYKVNSVAGSLIQPGARSIFIETVYPKGGIFGAPPSEVPQFIANDFVEADTVLPISPKASAALSRRCLQSLLVEKTGAKRGADLAVQIQMVLDNKILPSWLAENLDAIRNVGNFAAHPLKSTNTGEIIDVTPEEAEWNLSVLIDLFDFLCVQPELAKAKRDALEGKLAEAGKLSMKKPSN